MFSLADVRKKADELAARRAVELVDLDVDRVDGVDRPATGRNFIVMKSDAGSPVSPEDVLRLKAMAREKAAGPRAARKSMFADVMVPDAARTLPLEVQEDRASPRTHDDGRDALGRDYWDGAYDALGGMNGRGTSRETGLPAAPREPNFETAGGELQGPPEQYLVEEDVTYALPGGMRLLSPVASGLPTPLNFKAPEPAQVAKRAPRGIFKSILDPDSGASRHSTYFDEPKVEKAAKELGEGLFSSAVYDA
jgi:hypothetical protein